MTAAHRTRVLCSGRTLVRVAGSSWAARALIMLLAAGTVVAGEARGVESCTVLSGLDERDLSVYEFESEEIVWQRLPAEQEFVLGEIRLVRQPVFEAERNTLHRLANRYHPQTRERVILSALPVQPGDPVSQRILDESERILRAKSYLYDARVLPWRICGDRLDIVVVTRDVWTLTPIIAFTRSGGENDVSLGIADNNVLGSGKNVSIEYQSDKDRNGVLFFYDDPNLSGTRWTLDLMAVDSDDGGHYRLDLGRPFYALDARWGFGLSVDEFERDQGLYLLGSKFWEIGARTDSVNVALGVSEGVANGFVNRWFVGFAYEDNEFEFPSGFPSPGTDRRIVYPYLAFQRLEDRFDTRLNVDRVHRTEDLRLGRQIYAQLGWSDETFGANVDRLVGRFDYGNLDYLGRNHLLAYGVNVLGYYDFHTHRAEDLWASAHLDYRYNHGGRFSLLARASGVLVKNLPVDKQLLLGGDTGLRGYPNRYQAGDRRLLLTVEERYYADIYPFGMFRLGAAIFADVGRAWYVDDAPAWVPAGLDGPEFETLADVGFGFRFESTRTRRDRIMHVDLAFPLRDGFGVSGAELTVTLRQSL